MALRLRVVSDHRRLLGDRSTIVFGVGGGSIGRSADNDWVLPDPLRYVSAHHARVQFRQGAWYLEDLSTNGAFVNDDERPISRRGPYRLQHGDVLRFGEYQVVVAIDPEPAAAAPVVAVTTAGAVARPLAPAPDTDVAAVPTSIQELQGIARVGQTDIGASLNLSELLMPDSSPSDDFKRVNAYGQAVAFAAREPSARAVESEEAAAAGRRERLARIGERERKAASMPALYDVQTGLQAFCRGVGIDADKLPAEAQTRLLHLAGQLFREALVGLKDLERSQQDIRNRFRIELRTDPDDPRPSLCRSAVEDLVTALLSQHESRRLDAVQWLREALGAARRHGEVAAQAMRAAFVEFIGRLEPAELESRFERTARRGKLLGANRAAHWDLYCEFYRNLTEMPPDNLPHTFVETFATLYKEKFEQPPE